MYKYMSPASRSPNTGDQKVYQISSHQKVTMLLPAMGKCPMDFYQGGVVFTAQI